MEMVCGAPANATPTMGARPATNVVSVMAMRRVTG
jgi:hypothetical protein